MAFALPHHVTEEKKKMTRRNEECESARGESKNICNGEFEEQGEEGEKGEEKENLSSSESSTFSDGDEDNPPFIR